ncbi:palmitoyl-protein thioesterase 1-like [Apodemus sylvaticus]|uniref:palmitoyl-protein thioesterase 1-like n=1 Tax=Apodemus sylvaticus TaxID=10129 RepID=UPI0022430E3F|nr:palmitoyl-protein thioesterase 1-like [Apodemus sylvaticus]
MVLPPTLWLLSFCLLSCCSDARSLGLQDLQSKLWRQTFVLLFQKGETLSMNDIEIMFQMEKPGVHVLPVETEKFVKEDVENKVLYISTQACEILAKEPELWHRKILQFSELLQLL